MSALFVTLLLVIVVFVGLAVDFSAAYRAKSDQQESIEIVKDAVFASGEAIKFDSDTPRAVFDRVQEALALNDYTGTVTCWFYEVNKGYRTSSGVQLDESHRVAGMMLTASAAYKPLFLAVLMDKMSVGEESSWSFDFYSQADRIWRPLEGAQGRKAEWVFKNGAVVGTPTFTTIAGISDLPSDLKQTIEETVESI